MRTKNPKVKTVHYLPFTIHYSLFTAYCLLLIVFMMGCAPRAVSPPPDKDIPGYEEKDLTLEEIVTIARDDVDTLKIIAGINIEKDDKPHLYIDALILMKRPGWLHIRAYKFGMPVGNFLLKENEAYSLSTGNGSSLSEKFPRNLKEFSKELYRSVFWWEGLTISDCRFEISDCSGNTVMTKNEKEYIIKTESREIRIDKSTLLPVSQEVTVSSKKILILYDEHKKEGNFRYPLSVKIEAGNYRVSIRVEKLFVNLKLEENDFKEPQITDNQLPITDYQ